MTEGIYKRTTRAHLGMSVMLGYDVMGRGPDETYNLTKSAFFNSDLALKTELFDYNRHLGVAMSSTPSPCTYSQSSVDSPESTSNMSISPPLSVTLSPRSLQTLLSMTPAEQISHNIISSQTAVMSAPYLRILEQPVEKFRFRYKSEMMGTHGSLLGKNGDRNRKKTFPTVELCNYDGPAIIRCSLYSAQFDEKQRTPHTHRLVMREGTDDKEDPHEMTVSRASGYTAIFQGMGIIHTARKYITEQLLKKKRQRLMEQFRQKNINIKHLTLNEEAKLKAETDLEAKKMNLNVVTLYFECFQFINDIMVPICDPIFSVPINNMKSALTGELKICRVDKHMTSCLGNEEIFILVEKVGKKNIKIKVYEVDDEDNEIWCDYGKFSELDVHHQYAIVFRMPPYRDLEIEENVEVFIQLYRPTDGDCSDPIRFVYKPSDKTVGRNRKRARRSSGSEDLRFSSFVITPPHPELAMKGANPMMSESDIVTFPLDDMLDSPLPSFDDVLQENDYSSAEFQEFIRNLSISDYASTLEDEQGGVDMDLSTDGGGVRISLESAGAIKRVLMRPKGESERDKLLKRLTAKPLGDKASGRDTNALEQMLKRAVSTPEMTMSHTRYNDRDRLLKKVATKLADLSETKRSRPPRVILNNVRDLFNEKTDDGNTALHLALMTENTSYLNIILEVLCDGEKYLGTSKHDNFSDIIDTRNDNDETALHLAVLHNQPRYVATLLLGGANPNLVNGAGDVPLHLALNTAHNRCITELVNEKNYARSTKRLMMDIRNDQGWPPLHKAILQHNMSAVIKLCEAGADPNERDKTGGRTALHVAVEEQSAAVVRHLLNKTNVNIDHQNLAGNTALHVAVVVGENGSKELCDILLQARANPLLANYNRELVDDPEEVQPITADVSKVKKEPLDLEDARMTALDLATDNKEIFQLLQHSIEAAPPQERDYDEGDLVIDMKQEPPDDCDTLDFDSEDSNDEQSVSSQILQPCDKKAPVILDSFAREQLCKILDESKAWEQLAELLDCGFLVGGIRSSASPTQTLLSYIDLRGVVTLDMIRENLSIIGEMRAVEVIDLMMAMQIAEDS